VDGEANGDPTVSIFGQMKPLKKSKPVSTVKITFMGKPMELQVPMNEDLNIYDGRTIEGSSEAKSRSTWVEMFDMIDLAINNLQQQNKDLKRQVNELNSKLNKMSFHERKEEKTERNLKKVEPKARSEGGPEVTKKFEEKIQKIEENICQWIDDEAKSLKDSLEKDISSIRSEVDTKNIEMNSKVQSSIHELREELNSRSAEHTEIELPELSSSDLADTGTGSGWIKAVLDLKNKLHSNCNTLRFLCSEPLSVQFSLLYKGELSLPRESDRHQEVLPFNWVNSNIGGAVVDDLVSDVTTVEVPVSGHYLLHLSCDVINNSGVVWLCCNNRERLLTPGRSDILELDQEDVLEVCATPGTRLANTGLMGLLLRPRLFITPGTTM